MQRLKLRFKSLSPLGFSLIEILIAISLMAFVTMYAYQMIDNSTSSKENIVREDRDTVQSLTGTARMDADFSQIYSPLYSYFKKGATGGANMLEDAAINLSDASSASSLDGSGNSPAIQRINFDGETYNHLLVPQFNSEDKSSIIFFSSVHRRKSVDSKESRYAWIKYSMVPTESAPKEGDEKNSRHTANDIIRTVIATDIWKDDLDWANTKGQVIMSGVKDLEFQFWEERKKKFVTSLSELNENKTKISAIKVKIVVYSESGAEQTIEKIYRTLYPEFNTKQDQQKYNQALAAPPPSSSGSGGGAAGSSGLPEGAIQ